MIARPCLGCGVVIATGSRCAACRLPERPRRGRPSRPNRHAWRKLSKKVIKAEGQCQRCGTDGSEPNNPLTCDHVVPVSVGGEMVPKDPALVRTLCKRCNAAVYREQLAAARQTRGDAPPRQDPCHPGVRAAGNYSPGDLGAGEGS